MLGIEMCGWLHMKARMMNAGSLVMRKGIVMPNLTGFIDEQVEIGKIIFLEKLLLGVPHGRRGSHHIWWPLRW